MKQINGWRLTCLVVTSLFLIMTTQPLLAAETQPEFTLAQNGVKENRKDPSRAALLSTLYFGLGHMYAGDVQRGVWVMLAGSGLLIGGVIGLGALKDRPEEASSLGNILIYLALGGYYLWNIRDAFVTTEHRNQEMETNNYLSLLQAAKFSWKNDTLILTIPVASL